MPEVIAEAVYVLNGVYSVERSEIGEALIEFLNEVVIENREVMTDALTLNLIKCCSLYCTVIAIQRN